VFARILTELTSETTVPKTVMIDTTYLKVHRAATSLRAKKRGGRQSARAPDRAHERWVEHQVHAVADAKGRPIRLFMSAN